MKAKRNIIMEENNLLKRIIWHLFLNTSGINDLGLFHGKMGIVLFLYNCARFKKLPICEEFAGEILDEICNNLHMELPINFENGLCGIGWGIEYLIQNHFLEGNSNEILAVIDQKVMEYAPNRIRDNSLTTGVEGMRCYINARIASSPMTEMYLDKCFLTDLDLSVGYYSKYTMKQILEQIVPSSFFSTDSVIDWPLGLQHGCAGIGMLLIKLGN